MITPKQIKIARLLLDWDQKILAQKAGLSLPTIQRMEKSGVEKSIVQNVEKLLVTFKSQGIIFIEDGVNVRLELKPKT